MSSGRRKSSKQQQRNRLMHESLTHYIEKKTNIFHFLFHDLVSCCFCFGLSIWFDQNRKQRKISKIWSIIKNWNAKQIKVHKFSAQTYVFHIYFTRCSISISSQKWKRKRREWKKKNIVSIGRREQYFKRWLRKKTSELDKESNVLVWIVVVKVQTMVSSNNALAKITTKNKGKKVTSKCAVAQYIYLYMRGEALILVWNGSDKRREKIQTKRYQATKFEQQKRRNRFRATKFKTSKSNIFAMSAYTSDHTKIITALRISEK